MVLLLESSSKVPDLFQELSKCTNKKKHTRGGYARKTVENLCVNVYLKELIKKPFSTFIFVPLSSICNYTLSFGKSKAGVEDTKEGNSTTMIPSKNSLADKIGLYLEVIQNGLVSLVFNVCSSLCIFSLRLSI